MRKAALAGGIALLGGAASPVFAADMAVKAPKAPAVAEQACLRWVQTTYSWYNYCDPIPYYPRTARWGWAWGL
jgi:hypothetical protein